MMLTPNKIPKKSKEQEFIFTMFDKIEDLEIRKECRRTYTQLLNKGLQKSSSINLTHKGLNLEQIFNRFEKKSIKPATTQDLQIKIKYLKQDIQKLNNEVTDLRIKVSNFQNQQNSSTPVTPQPEEAFISLLDQVNFQKW